MTAALHTPGPWQAIRVDPVDGFAGFTILAQPSPVLRGFTKTIADVYGPDSGIEGHEANARLIAAAPDLFSIVKRFVALPSGAWHPERHAAEEAELMQEARAAIAKAVTP